MGGPLRYAVWTAALAVDAAGALGMLSPRRHVPLNPWHLTERFQLFVLIVLGESVARLISAAATRPWSVPLAVVLTAAVVTLATLWWAWIRTSDHQALDRPGAIAAFAAANLPIVGGIAAASAGLHLAILAADGATTIGIGPRAALYGGVSVCLLASAILPSRKMTALARAVRLATSAAAMGLVFMGAIVIPVYLVPALTLTLALGLSAESCSARKLDRPPGPIRVVPTPPVLVAMLRGHLRESGTAPGGRMFRGARAGMLSESVYGRAWHAGRQAALDPELAATALARRPYDLRHSALSLWLNASGAPAEVAARAGNSARVLHKVYPHCIEGHEDLVSQRIEYASEHTPTSIVVTVRERKRLCAPSAPPGPCPLTCIAAVTQVVPRWPHFRFAGVLHSAPLP